MKILKKLLMFVVCFCLFGLMFSGCFFSPKKTGKSIVCTIFPAYDWLKQILGEKMEEFDVKLLSDGGADMHSFNPTVDDIASICDADILIYVGGESESWVGDALKNATNKNMIKISLLEVLGESALDEEKVEGMQAEDGETEKDEHVWLSLKNARLFVSEIASAVSILDENNKDYYLNNAEKYNEKLTDLDVGYSEAVQNASKKTILVGDRFPFVYLVKDYGLNYFAAFAGCNADAEAKFETIIFLAEKVDELGLNVILKIEGSSDAIAKQIRQNTESKNQNILTLNSLQSVKNKNETSYLSVMQQNLEVLKNALA